MTGQTRRWVRVGLVYLAVMFLTVGLWATFASESFFRDFPGGGHHWVAGDGPYNVHLVTDAGIGFLAVAAVVVLAAVWMERRLVQTALVVATLHNGLHLLFHLRHPSALGSVDKLGSYGGIGFGALVALGLLVVVTRR